MNKVTRTGAYAVIRNEDEVLLCKLTRSGMWTLPGGGLEFGETPGDAMIREVKEETGFDVELAELLGVNSVVTRRVDEIHSIQIVYAANIIAGDLTAELDGTTNECCWHKWSNLSNLNTTAAVKYVYENFGCQST